uniref:Fork-head domain-containing protein n=1 Tax=Parastrongyloides trichosuri TaxID=131310 RepID=A0A0N4ZGS5_PARTI
MVSNTPTNYTYPMKSINRKMKSVTKALSFPQLVGLILMNTTTKALPVNEMYDIVKQLFTCYTEEDTKWKNLIRHNLSTKEWFTRISDPSVNNGIRQTSIWGFSKLSFMDEVMRKVNRIVLKNSDSIRAIMRNPNLFDSFISGKLMIVPKNCGTYKYNLNISIEHHYKEFYRENIDDVNMTTKLNNQYLDNNLRNGLYSPVSSTCSDDVVEDLQRRSASLKRKMPTNYVEDIPCKKSYYFQNTTNEYTNNYSSGYYQQPYYNYNIVAPIIIQNNSNPFCDYYQTNNTNMMSKTSPTYYETTSDYNEHSNSSCYTTPEKDLIIPKVSPTNETLSDYQEHSNSSYNSYSTLPETQYYEEINNVKELNNTQVVKDEGCDSNILNEFLVFL